MIPRRALCIGLLTALLASLPAPAALGGEPDALAAARKILEQVEAESAPAPVERLRALRTLEGVGDASALPLAVRVASGLDVGVAASRAATQSWTRILRAALGERWRPRPLIDGWPKLATPLRRATVRVLVEKGARTELTLATDLVAQCETDLPALFTELRRASPVVASQVALVRFYRKYTPHPEPAVRAAAAKSLGRTTDADACKVLMTLLEDEDASVRKSADRGLRTLTKARAGSTAAWKQWLEGEDRWQRESGVPEGLRSSDAVEVSHALRDLGRHRLVGLRVREAITRLLRHEVVGIRLMAFSTLRRIESAGDAAHLVDSLEDSDERVRTAVWQALKALSGEDLPLDAEAWKSARRRWRS